MKKISTMTLHQQVAQVINDMIRSSELQGGQKINEMRLCELMGDSRTPIRKALLILISQGMIYLIPHNGVFSCTKTSKSIFLPEITAPILKRIIFFAHSLIQSLAGNAPLNEDINGLLKKKYFFWGQTTL